MAKKKAQAVWGPPIQMPKGDVPRDACPKCEHTLAEHELDFFSQAPYLVVKCPS